MDTEDGVIWVYGVNDDEVLAFTEFGIENLTHLIEMHREDPTILSKRCGGNTWRRGVAL
jgi:hypothetical protein